MQTLIETTNDLGRRITITIDVNKIHNAVKKELINMSKKMRINGFRKGKIPINIMYQRYENSVRKDMIIHLMEDLFIDFLKKNKIDLIGIPNYIPGEYNKDENFQYTVEFEIYPTIQLNGLDNIQIIRPLVKITEIDIDIMINNLRRQKINWIKSNESASLEDRVTIDFSGYIDNKKISNITTNNFVFILGKNKILPDLEEGIIGHYVNDDIILDITFPEDYHLDELKNQKVTFHITIKKIEKGIMPNLDENFIKQFKMQNYSINDFRSEIKKNMKQELKNNIYHNIKNQIINSLIKTNNFALPTKLIDIEINKLYNQALQNGKNIKENTSIEKKIFAKQAKHNVKIGLLLNEIIKIYKIQADQLSINNTIKKIALSYQDPQKFIYLCKQDKNMIENIKNKVLENKIIEILLTKAKITDKHTNFQDLIIHDE
ncbi:MAG: trigger factor [Pantoea sp. Brub]|nr:trigger factor [Pantoea sp. Brub]